MGIHPVNRRAIKLNKQTTKCLTLMLHALSLAGRFRQSGNTVDPCIMMQFVMISSCSLVALGLHQNLLAKNEYHLVCHVAETIWNEFYRTQNVSRKRRLAKKGTVEEELQDGERRRLCRHKHERAKACAMEDWIGKGPEPNAFTDLQFEETFRVTKAHCERLIQACCDYEPAYFVPGKDAVGKPGVIAEVKVLTILKCIGCGCSPRAFRDCGQMGVNATTECLKAFFRAILADEELRAEHLREPTPQDVRNICKFHAEKHGVEGFFLSLDCVHIWWKNCPVAWQGQYKNGKNKMSSVAMECGADWNSRLWSTVAGHPGANNDQNNWDASPLLAAFLSSDFNKRCDFPFVIDGQKFNKVWLLVDGVHPEIARFVKTLKFPNDDASRIFVKWQESARKDSERAFGILFRKFQFLTRPIECWDITDVKNQCHGCSSLHNMMAETRVDRGEREDAKFYRLSLGNKDEALAAARNLETYCSRSLIKNPNPEQLIGFQRAQAQRFKELHDEDEHLRLQRAVMNQVATNSAKHKVNRCKKFLSKW